MKKIKVGVIGCGRIVVMHLNAISNIEDAELVAVSDIKIERANEVAHKYNCRAYLDYQEMIEKEKLDCVHLCLPHYLHTKVAIDCFKKGINVLSEKPMSIDYESAVNAIEFAERKKLLYGVIFQCRYNKSTVAVKKAVESKALGKLNKVVSILTWSRPDSYYLESDWKGTWDKEGGGVLIDQAIHTIDLVNYIVSSPVKNVSATIRNRGHKTVDVEDTAEGLIEYENGTKYYFYAMNNFAIDEPIEIKMYFDNGYVKFGYTEAMIKYNSCEIIEVKEKMDHTIIDNSKDYWGFMHETQIRQFYKAVLKEEELDISARKVLQTHKIIFDIYDKCRGEMK